MTARTMGLSSILLAVGFALVFGAAAWASRGRSRAKIEFDEARIFFEFNSTDDDLGIQVFLDGEAWKRLNIRGPRGRQILEISAKANLGKLGLTELFFESDEPSPEEVLDLFPPGEYEFEGRTVEGGRIEAEATLSHELAPVPVIQEPDPGEEVDPENTVIQWDPIPGIAGFEIIVENEDVGAEMLVPLPADATSLDVPEQFLDSDTEYKVEVIAIAKNGNKTISEHEFVTSP